MKKISMKMIFLFGIVLCTTLILTLGVSATEVASGTCGDNLTWVYDTTKTLTISGSGAMDNWDNYNCPPLPWEKYRHNIEAVVINEGVTTIGDGAFDSCTDMTNIILPESLTYIGINAFYGCPNLTEINIPDNVTKIGVSAFSYCDNLESVYIGNSVERIGDYAFAECRNLKKINIPDSITYIGACAFYYCQSMWQITIENGFMYIEHSAFDGCFNLKTVRYMGTEEQWNMITIGDNNEYLSDAKILFVINYGDNLFYTLEGNGTLTIFGEGNMPDHKSAASVPWYDQRDRIKSVIIKGGVSSIGSYAFYECSNLEKVSIGTGVTSVGDYAFYSCSAIENVTLGTGVSFIGDYVFCNCSSLKNVIIGHMVTSIGDFVFSGCSQLTDIYYTGSRESWENVYVIWEYGKIYLLDMGIVVHFDSIAVTEISILGADDESTDFYTISPAVTNISYNTPILIATYDKNGALLELKRTFPFGSMPTFSKENVKSIRIFVWKSMKEPTPLCSAGYKEL